MCKGFVFRLLVFFPLCTLLFFCFIFLIFCLCLMFYHFFSSEGIIETNDNGEFMNLVKFVVNLWQSVT